MNHTLNNRQDVLLFRSRAWLRTALLVLLLILGLWLLLGAPPPAGAVVPGINGQIAFVSNRDNGNRDIYVMNVDGSDQTRLTDDAAVDLLPAWSPDGTKIAFVSARDGNDLEIYVMNADGTGQTRLTNSAGTDTEPAWSPDGTKIAFRSDRDGPGEIYVMNADGTGQTRLTNNTDFDARPDWSPDGTKIAFDTDRDGNTEVYVMNADGTGQSNISNNGANDATPVWSPDGTKIAFRSDRIGNEEIYVMNADGTGQTNLTNNVELDADPYWSPDGTQIAFTSDRTGNPEVFVMNADGSGQINLTNNAAEDFHPSWGGLPPGFCPVSTPGVGYKMTTILGTGMGDTRSSKKISKLVIPHADEVVGLYGQLAAKQGGLVKYVRFIYPNNSFEQVKPETSLGQQLAISWWGSELDVDKLTRPFIRGRWFLPGASIARKLPRAFILYPTYQTAEAYANAFETFSGTDNWVAEAGPLGFSPSQTFMLEIPETQGVTDVSGQLAIVDNDRDLRGYRVVLTADSATTTLDGVPGANTNGKLLDILDFTLEDVPAGTTEIEIELTVDHLPVVEQESVALVGATANYACAVATP